MTIKTGMGYIHVCMFLDFRASQGIGFTIGA